MTHAHGTHINSWRVIAIPALAGVCAVLEEVGIVDLHAVPVLVVAVALLIGTVFCAVHHAEVIALRIGEPMGSLVLAVAVTVIEVSLIIAIMVAAPEGGSEVARDTVFAAVMIVLTGIVGVCLLTGALRHREQEFHAQGTNGALSVLATLAVLALVLPNFTVAVPGPFYSPGQLLAVGVMSFGLYFLFLFIQSFRHREYFLDAAIASEVGHEVAIPPRAVAVSLAMLFVALAAVVLIAEGLSPVLDEAIAAVGLPTSFVGVVIAAVILLPESIAAFRAAFENRMQQSLNLALGSALASIGLTIPSVGLVSILLGVPLGLGLEPEHTLLLVLALFISTLTLITGRTNILQGGVHLVIFAAFLIIAAIP